MADLSQKWKENKTGKMFVDQSCIACDACVLTAPKKNITIIDKRSADKRIFTYGHKV